MQGASRKSRAAPRWGVVATVLEPTELLAAFVAHHLDLGASEVILFLDAPAPEAEARLVGVTGCRAIRADARHFRKVMGCDRPARPGQRRQLNTIHAAHIARVDWLLPLDADEFLSAVDFAAELQEVPDIVDALRIPNGERVYMAGAPPLSVFDGVLRLPVRGKPWRQRQFLNPALELYTDRGMCGYATGKTCLRTGRKGQPRIGHAQEALICHFDGMTPAHWGAKLAEAVREGRHKPPLRQQMAPHRAAQIDFAAACGSDPDIVQALHDGLRQLVSAEFQRLEQHGLARQMPIDPMRSTRRMFPDIVDRLSVGAFDAALPDRFAEPGDTRAA